jgi:ribosomal peptide maturation radical SAM protein 1
MLKISLINMPFADLWFPSIALTQIKAVLEEQFGEKVSVRILYLNQDIAQYLGVRLYCYISNSLETNMAALGDWLFRSVAFPDAEENVSTYFQRCFPGEDPATLSKKQAILRKRKGLSTFLDRLIVKYDLASQDVVGFTSMFCQNVACFAMAKRIKGHNSRVITAMGGANCEAPMGQELIRNVDQLDYVFSGSGLISFPLFVKACLEGEPPQDGIRGMFSKQNAAKPLGGHESLGQELDINHYVPLDYTSFLDTLEKNFSKEDISPVLLFETSRGCWWGQKAHCTFCGLNGGTMAYRAMQPAVAIRQFEDLFQFASRCSHFDAVDNILPKSYVGEVLPHIDPPESVDIFYEVKADLSKADVEVLAKAQVKRIQPGIEALNTKTLKLMKKGTTVFQNLALLKNCASYGVHPEWNLLIGFPGEPEEVFIKYIADIPLLVHLTPPAAAFHVRFDRYSPYFVQAQQYGLDLHPSDFYSFIYPFKEEVLPNIAYYFSNHNYSAEYITSVTQWSERVKEKIAYWRSRWEAVGQQVFPKLVWRIKDGQTVVYDSRNGQESEHEPGANGKAILEHLVVPKRRSDVISLFPNFDADKEITRLQQMGLLFEEDGRLMSLVVEELVAHDHSGAIHLLASESPAQGLLA